jgi:hypothetical protein
MQAAKASKSGESCEGHRTRQITIESTLIVMASCAEGKNLGLKLRQPGREFRKKEAA